MVSFLRSVTTGQYSTQISKFFPKASTSTQPVDCELLPRKRKAPPIETITSDPLVTAEVTPKKIPKKSTPREPPTITKFFQFNDDNSSDEFETPRKPQPIARAPPPKKAPTKKSKIKPKKGANKNSIVSKFFSNDGIDPEHLQMALALSRSVEQTSGPCENTETAEETMSTQEKRVAVKNMFQKFGFKAPASRGEQQSDQCNWNSVFQIMVLTLLYLFLFRRFQSEFMAWFAKEVQKA